MDTKEDKPRFTFKLVDKASRDLIYDWMAQEHVREWFYGEGMKRMLDDLEASFQAPRFWQHWLAYDKDVPFCYLLTSEVKKKEDDEYDHFCQKEGKAITLDILIGNPQYLGKGLAHQVIQEFLLNQFPHVQEVLIDPDVTNLRAIHVYEKAGFSIVEKFIPSHSPRPHYMMHLDMEALKQATKRPLAQFVQHKGGSL